MAKKTPKTQKPKEINLLNIIILVAAVVLNPALGFCCYRIRCNAASSVDGLFLMSIILFLHYPTCLFCDIYAGLHIRDSWYLPIVSPLIMYIIDPIAIYSSDDPVSFLTGLAVHMAIMLLVAGIKKMVVTLKEKKKV